MLNDGYTLRSRRAYLYREPEEGGAQKINIRRV
jgi:hypothetical protein